MATVLEEYTTEDQRSVVRFFCGQKNTMNRIFIKKMFPIYSGKCLSRKAIHTWVEKFSHGRSKVADNVRPGAEVAKTTVKRLLCCVRCTGKAIGQVHQCWWSICREINVFQVSILYVLCFISICDLFIDSTSDHFTSFDATLHLQICQRHYITND
jgi:hypothetical protein